MTAMRKVYQRAIVTPTHHVEQLWKDYENFENSVSRALVMVSFLPPEMDSLRSKIIEIVKTSNIVQLFSVETCMSLVTYTNALVVACSS